MFHLKKLDIKRKKHKIQTENINSSTTQLNRRITFLLGCFWIIAGVLQFQPKMFSQAFINLVLFPTAQNQPLFVSNLVDFGINMFEKNMLLANFTFAFIQLLIGIFLVLPLSKKAQRFALFLSIFWGITVWVFGEGFDGLFTGMASFYTGVPGSVLLYLIPAVFLLFPKRFSLSKLPMAAGIIFLTGALLSSLPMFWRSGMTQMIFQMSASDPIELIAAPAKYFSNLAYPAFIMNGLLIIPLLVFGLLLVFRPNRIVGWGTIIFLVIVWWVGQDFGEIQTFPNGTATDLNSAPIFALFLIPLFSKIST